MAGIKSKGPTAKELYEMKMQAQRYYAENGVPQKMENVLNTMYFDKPNDVYGHLANYFEEFALTPKISKVISRIAYDSRALPVIQTEIYCIIKNFEKLISTSTSSYESFPPETAKPEDIEQAIAKRKINLESAIVSIKQHLEAILINEDPCEQEEVDKMLMSIHEKFMEDEEERLAKEKEEKKEDDAQSTVSGPAPVSQSPGKRKSAKGGKSGKAPAVVIIPDEPREVLLAGCQYVCAMSQAVCEAGAVLSGLPLYEHIASYAHDGQGPSKFNLPLPMVTILNSGKMWPGKQNCVKEFMLVPKPGMPAEEYMKHLSEIYHYCAKLLLGKTGIISKNVNDIGALCPTYDKPEQGLDLLQDAITQQGLTPGEDFNIALNLQGQEIFDYDKGKYEVITGGLKASEDMGDYYGDLVTRYPAIICIIDPIRKEEKESWMKLCARVTPEQVYVAGDTVYKRPGILKDMEVVPEFRTSATVLHMDNVTTVTDIVDAAKNMKENNNEIIISTQTGESMDPFLVDLAVGINARFIKIGAPTRERISKLNRLLQLEDQLQRAGKLAELEEHQFPVVRPPTPEPVEEPTDESDKAKTPTSGRSEKK